MAKKRIYTPKQTEPTPVEEPWSVVGAPGTPLAGMPVYLSSSLGISEERARELASRLQGAVAIPLLQQDA